VKRADGNEWTQRVKRSVAEWIDMALADDEAHNLLMRHGIKVESEFLFVAARHEELSRIFRDTPWAAGWAPTLGRLEGAESGNQTARLFSAVKKGVRILLHLCKL
jgi:hypothetical protein